MLEKIVGISLLLFIMVLAIMIVGYTSITPYAVLVGAFISGLITRDFKYGALIGLFASIGVLLFLAILLVIFLIVLFIFILFPPMIMFAIDILSFMIALLLPAVLFSPITGALGGFFGSLIFKRKKEPIVSVPYSVTPSPPTNLIICPSCGISNDSSYRFCRNCGTRLR